VGLVKGRIAFISNRASKADSRQGNTVHVVTVVVYLEFLTAAAAGCVNVARVVIIVLQHGLDRDALATRVNFNPFRALILVIFLHFRAFRFRVLLSV